MCSRPGCDRPAYCRTICQYHYLLARRKGLPIPPSAPRPSREERFWAKVKKTRKCWIWTGVLSPYGYGIFRYADSGHSGGAMLAHRASWMLNNGNPGDLFVCHKCDNPPCVRPDHLFLGSADDNAKDCVAKGRTPVGAKHGMSKLTAADVKAIRESSLGVTALSREFGVSHSAISFIVHRRRWKHVA